MTQLMRFVAVLLISSVFTSCVVKSTNRHLSLRPLNIQGIQVAEGADKTIVEIEGERFMVFTTFRLTSPDRLVLEISEVGLGKYHNEIKMNEGPILAMVPVPSGDIHISRLEFNLSGLVETDVRPEGLNIVIEVTQLESGKERAVASQDQPAASHFRFFEDEAPVKKGDSVSSTMTSKTPATDGSTLVELPPPLMSPDARLKKNSKPKIESVKASPSQSEDRSKELPPATSVTGLEFIEGKPLRMLISMDGQVNPKIFYSNRTKRHIVIDLPGVKKINQVGMPGDGHIVQKLRSGMHPEKLRIVLDLLTPVKYAVRQDQGKLEITLKKDGSLSTFPK